MTESSEEGQSTVDTLSTLATGGALVSFSKFLSLGFGFLTQVTMARLLTEAAYGQVVLTMSIINVGGLIAKLGLDDGLTREFPHHEDSPKKARGVIWAGFVIGTVSGVIVAAVVFVVSPILASQVFDEPSYTALFRLAAVAIPFVVITSIAVSLSRGSRDARPHAYVNQLFKPAMRLVFIGTFVFAGFGAIGAITGQILAIVLAALVALLFAWRILPIYDGPTTPMYRSVLAFSVPLIAVQGMGFVNSNVDVYMVGYYLESASLGVYNIALQLGNLLTAVLVTTGFLLPPILTRLHKQDKQREMRRMFQILTKWMLVFGLPVFVVLFFAPEFVIGLLFGESYTSGTTALRVLLVGKLVAIVMGLNGSALVALGDNRIVSIIVFCETVINVALNVLLIPVVGIVGAAIGMAVSSVVGDSLGVAILYRRHRLHPFTKPVLATVSAVAAFGGISYGFLWMVGLPTFAVVPLVGIAYVPIVASLAPEPEDEQLLTRVEDRTEYDLTFVRRAFRMVS